MNPPANPPDQHLTLHLFPQLQKRAGQALHCSRHDAGSPAAASQQNHPAAVGRDTSAIARFRAALTTDVEPGTDGDSPYQYGHCSLFTTFTRTLAQSIKENLVKLAGPAVLHTIDVLTVDGLARRVLAATDTDREKIRKVTVLGDTDQKIRGLWEQAAASANTTAVTWSVDFLVAEWSTVVLAQGITDRAAYLKATRAGRGRRLSRIDRAALWQIFERFTLLLEAHERTTFTQIASRAAQVPTNGVVYRHAVVDEAQDLHPAHWRLLRHVVPNGPDDIFLVGDAHQRIYAYKVTLSALGIETRGRSRRLTVNYRTSR